MTSAQLLALGSEAFVSLTTFRRTGIGVSTPVWIARDGDALVVTTPARSGKVKRLRKNASVTLRPSGRMGNVDPHAPLVTATASIEADPAEVQRCSEVLHAKYGAEYTMIMGIESRFAGGRQDRVILRITD